MLKVEKKKVNEVSGGNVMPKCKWKPIYDLSHGKILLQQLLALDLLARIVQYMLVGVLK